MLERACRTRTPDRFPNTTNKFGFAPRALLPVEGIRGIGRCSWLWQGRTDGSCSGGVREEEGVGQEEAAAQSFSRENKCENVNVESRHCMLSLCAEVHNTHTNSTDREDSKATGSVWVYSSICLMVPTPAKQEAGKQQVHMFAGRGIRTQNDQARYPIYFYGAPSVACRCTCPTPSRAASASSSKLHR